MTAKDFPFFEFHKSLPLFLFWKKAPSQTAGREKPFVIGGGRGNSVKPLTQNRRPQKRKKKFFLFRPPTPFPHASFWQTIFFLKKIFHPVWWSPPCARQSPPPSPPAERCGQRQGKTRRTPGNGTKCLTTQLTKGGILRGTQRGTCFYHVCVTSRAPRGSKKHSY